MDETVGFPESGMSLPIKIGRIDIPAVLQEASMQLNHKGRVGFYCGGAYLSLFALALCDMQLAYYGLQHQCCNISAHHSQFLLFVVATLLELDLCIEHSQ